MCVREVRDQLRMTKRERARPPRASRYQVEV